jgi:hypothetical protein
MQQLILVIVTVCRKVNMNKPSINAACTSSGHTSSYLDCLNLASIDIPGECEARKSSTGTLCLMSTSDNSIVRGSAEEVEMCKKELRKRDRDAS